MKREELVRYDGEWYDANIVDCLLDEKDAEIAELKAENLNLKAKNIELQSFYNLHGNVDNYIDKLKAENEQFKAKLESVQATAYAESVDAGMENRRLKRALWMARGCIMTLLNRDFQRLAYQCNNDDYKRNLLRRRNRYYELSEKCLKKAKEYK